MGGEPFNPNAWRLKVHHKYNEWIDFQMTPEILRVLHELNATVHIHSEIIIFREIEDVTVFKLRTGI